MAAKHNRGAAELERMKSVARASVQPVTDTNFAGGAHPRRGQIADSLVEGDNDSRQQQAALDRAVKAYRERLASADPVGSHDDS